MLGYFYGDIVGFEEGASRLRSDRQCKRSVSKGYRFNKAAQAQQAPSRTSIPRLLPVRVLKLAPCHERRLLSQAAAADEK